MYGCFLIAASRELLALYSFVWDLINLIWLFLSVCFSELNLKFIQKKSILFFFLKTPIFMQFNILFCILIRCWLLWFLLMLFYYEIVQKIFIVSLFNDWSFSFCATQFVCLCITKIFLFTFFSICYRLTPIARSSWAWICAGQNFCYKKKKKNKMIFISSSKNRQQFYKNGRSLPDSFGMTFPKNAKHTINRTAKAKYFILNSEKCKLFENSRCSNWFWQFLHNLCNSNCWSLENWSAFIV